MAATDDFSTQSPGLDAPAGHIAVVTPNDSTDLTKVTRGISISGTGALKVITVYDETVTFASGDLATQVVYPFRIKRVYSTGTGATGIWAYW